jgi:hypothetical protein
MRRLTLRSAVILGLLATPLVATPAPDPTTLEHFRQGVADSIASIEKRLSGKEPDEIPTRDLATAAHWMLATDADRPRAQEFVERVLSLQDMDPDSPRFGDVPWLIGVKRVNDANAVQFTFMQLGAIARGHSEKLSPALRERLPNHLRAAITAIRRHEVPVTYTNIFLKKTANLSLLGESVGDRAAIDEARGMLVQWLDHTRQFGIREFNSPTYHAVSISCAQYGYVYSSDPEVKRLFAEVCDIFWRDALANYFPGRQSMSGARSRDADFSFGRGGIDSLYRFEGIAPPFRAPPPFSSSYHAYINHLADGWRPKQELRAIADTFPRLVLSRYGNREGETRVNYITRDFSISSASRTFTNGMEDKLLTIELASDAPMPDSIAMISLIPDYFDSPYGKRLARVGTGHMKPRHLRVGASIVQQNDLVLALIDLGQSVEAREDDFETLSTNLILPMQADAIYANADRVDMKPNAVVQLSTQDAVYVREGNSVVGLRIFHVDVKEPGTQSPSIALKFDGAEWGVGRLVAYHYQGAPIKLASNDPIRAGLVARVARCETDAEFTAFRNAFARLEPVAVSAGSIWSVTLVDADAGITLEAALEAGRMEPLWRRINGADVESPAFEVRSLERESR